VREFVNEQQKTQHHSQRCALPPRQTPMVNYAAGIEHLHSLFVFDGQGGRVLSSEVTLSPLALSKQAVLLPWRAAAYVQTSWVLLLCGLIGLLANVVIRSVRARLKIEHGLLAAHDKLTAANTQLTQLARYDGMTGLANRRNFDATLRGSLPTRQP